MGLHMNLFDLDREIRDCRRCELILSNWPDDPPSSHAPVRPRPILSRPGLTRILLIGQAPGLTEYRGGLPFSGGAGRGIRDLLAKCGLQSSEFDKYVYQTSIMKCFPGRRLNKTRYEDRIPCASMTANCIGFLGQQIELISPRLIITLGGFAVTQLDRLRKIKRRNLSEVVGRSDQWNEARIVYLPHTSGSSRFLNDPANLQSFLAAQNLLSKELIIACKP